MGRDEPVKTRITKDLYVEYLPESDSFRFTDFRDEPLDQPPVTFEVTVDALESARQKFPKTWTERSWMKLPKVSD